MKSEIFYPGGKVPNIIEVGVFFYPKLNRTVYHLSDKMGICDLKRKKNGTKELIGRWKLKVPIVPVIEREKIHVIMSN